MCIQFPRAIFTNLQTEILVVTWLDERLHSVCDGCGELFTLGHALDCKKGGLVTQRHNEVRDALGDIAALAYRDVVHEPIVRESDESRGINALVADLRIRGVWQPQTAALFDIRVVHTDAQSYVGRSVQVVLKSAELDKKIQSGCC